MLRDVLRVVFAELEEGFVAGANECEDLMLALHAHFARIFEFFGESVAEGLWDCGAGHNNVAGVVRAWYHLGPWWW